LTHIKYEAVEQRYKHPRQADQHQSLSASVLWQSQGGGPKLDLSSQAIGDRSCPAQPVGGTGCASVKSGATAGVHQMRTGRSAFGACQSLNDFLFSPGRKNFRHLSCDFEAGQLPAAIAALQPSSTRGSSAYRRVRRSIYRWKPGRLGRSLVR
jgi:hypothetical protein